MASYVIATNLSALVPTWADRFGPLTAAVGTPCGDHDASGVTQAMWIPSAGRVEQPLAKAGFRPPMVDVPGPPPRGAPV